MGFEEAAHQITYDLLTASPELMSAVTGIHSHVIQGPDTGATPFPYITIGDISANEDSTDDANGADVESEVHVWSRYSGTKELHEIVGLVHAAMTRKAATAPGINILDVEFVDSDFFFDPDGMTRQGIVTFRILMTR